MWKVYETDRGCMILSDTDRRSVGDQKVGVSHQFLTSGTYETRQTELLVNLVKLRRRIHNAPFSVIDAGANLGAFTLPMARELGAFGTVYAIEMQIAIYYALCGNIALNSVHNVKAINCALGESTGFIDINFPHYDREASYGSFSILREINEARGFTELQDRKERVSVRTIDELSFFNVGVIKLDVEGAELDVLKGSRKLLHTSKPYIYVEVLSKCTEICDVLTSSGYIIFPDGDNVLAIPEADAAVGHIVINRREI